MNIDPVVDARSASLLLIFFRGEPLHALVIYGTYSQKPRRLWDDRRPAFLEMNLAPYHPTYTEPK